MDNEVLIYPERGENNLNGWSEIRQLNEEGVDPSRLP
jgi:hypothetical protein